MYTSLKIEDSGKYIDLVVFRRQQRVSSRFRCWMSTEPLWPVGCRISCVCAVAHCVTGTRGFPYFHSFNYFYALLPRVYELHFRNIMLTLVTDTTDFVVRQRVVLD